MQRVLIILISIVVTATLSLMGVFFLAHKGQGPSRANLLPSQWDLGKGSIQLGRTSAVVQKLSLAPELANQPIPTNKWWSSALVAPWPNVMFNLPWATKLSASGLQLGIPRVTATSNLISAPFAADLNLTAPGVNLASSRVNAYDDVSVGIQTLDDHGQEVFRTRLVKGVPYVYIAYNRPLVLTTAAAPAIGQLSDGRRSATVTINSQLYEVISSPGSTMASGTTGVTITPAMRGDDLVFVALPSGLTAAQTTRYEDGAKPIVTGGHATFDIHGNTATTTMAYATSGGETLHLVLPNQLAAGSSTSDLGKFSTVRGTASVDAGNILSYSQTVPNYTDQLSLPKDDAFFQKAKLEQYLQQAAKTDLTPVGTSYFGGKELFRLANLVDMARQAGSPTAPAFQRQLHDEMVNWLTYTPGEQSKYFAYDSGIKGLVAVTPEFGSDNFNDHHFHYGYFLDAASTLAKYDPGFLKDYGKTVDLIANDIATTDASSPSFARLRNYDPYEGHSWADGFAQFADGNNQESTSEAVNAWYGVMRWGKVSSNTQLTQVGQWLYTNETADSLTYNFNNTKANPFPSSYSHHQISLLWGGKGDWATFFSALPEAKHGILMLPISGGSLYLNTGTNLADDFQALNTELSGKSPTTFSDVLLMAKAMTDPAGAEAGFNDNITPDNSNTLAYIYYWIAWSAQNKPTGSKS